MKCIHSTTNPKEPVLRVDDELADQAVRSGRFRYASKEEWKKGGRCNAFGVPKPTKEAKPS